MRPAGDSGGAMSGETKPKRAWDWTVTLLVAVGTVLVLHWLLDRSAPHRCDIVIVNTGVNDWDESPPPLVRPGI